MKKLTNVSPFLLLLFPVLIMMVMALAFNNPIDDQEAVAKTATTGSFAKATTAILK